MYQNDECCIKSKELCIKNEECRRRRGRAVTRLGLPYLVRDHGRPGGNRYWLDLREGAYHLLAADTLHRPAHQRAAAQQAAGAEPRVKIFGGDVDRAAPCVRLSTKGAIYIFLMMIFPFKTTIAC